MPAGKLPRSWLPSRLFIPRLRQFPPRRQSQSLLLLLVHRHRRPAKMKLSIPSFARKLSIPSPKRTWRGKKRPPSRSRSEAPSSASSSADTPARSSTTPRSVLPRRELEAVLRRLGHEEPSDEEVDAVAAIAAEPPGAEDDLMEAFRVFDGDGDGRITAEELRAVMGCILGDGEACSLDDCRRMIGAVDADGDGDGFVGFEDFARMMMTNAPRTAGACWSDRV